MKSFIKNMLIFRRNQIKLLNNPNRR